MNDGNNLWNAVNLVIRAGREIVAMQAEVTRRLSDKLQQELEGVSCEAGRESSDQEDGWVCTAWLAQWGLKPTKSRRKSAWQGNLSVQIVLWSDDGPRDTIGMIPRVEVAYCSAANSDTITPDSFSAGTWFATGALDAYSVTEDGRCIFLACEETNESKLSFNGAGAEWYKPIDWIFAVPLFEINDSNAIERHIVTPIAKLLSGTRPDIALQNVGAIKFSQSTEGLLVARR